MNDNEQTTDDAARPAENAIRVLTREIEDLKAALQSESDLEKARETETALQDLHDLLKYEIAQHGRSFDDFINDDEFLT